VSGPPCATPSGPTVRSLDGAPSEPPEEGGGIGFGGQLAFWMQSRGVGVRQLSRRSGYSAGYITQLRQGLRRPSADAARDLDDALEAGGTLTERVPVCKPKAVSGLGDLLAPLLRQTAAGGPGGLCDREYKRLVRSLANWGLQTNRRDLLGVLGAAATAASSSPLLEHLPARDGDGMTAAPAPPAQTRQSSATSLQCSATACARRTRSVRRLSRRRSSAASGGPLARTAELEPS
jgi:transcriptional regulator with XRE-family HTH domain